VKKEKPDGRKPKKYADDDGRVIANMNVEGMRWYSEAKPLDREPERAPDIPELTKAETRVFIFGALKAALLIGGIFIGAAALFILFCVYVWFR